MSELSTMLQDALIIFKKETGNVFRDFRAVFTNYVLPILIMPLMFFIIGFVQKSSTETHKETVYHLALVNSPGAAFEKLLGDQLKYSADLAPGSAEGVTVEFPAGWAEGQPGRVRVMSDGTRQDMKFAAGQVRAALDAYNKSLTARKLEAAGLKEADLNPLVLDKVDVAPKNAQGTELLAMLLPYLLLLMPFSSAMGMGMAVTAGEKEKGCLASLLVNQVSRSSIALGKTLFILMSSLMSALLMSASMILSVVLMGLFFSGGDSGQAAAQAAAAGDFSLNFIGALVEPGNLVVFILTVLLASGLAASSIVCLGTKARNLKEATGYTMPVLMLVIIAGVATQTMDTTKDINLYLIPLVNAVFVMKGAITGSLLALNVAVSLLINAAAIVILAWLTTREFNSERVLYTE
jgi:sodium transport system permease protein